MSVASGYPGRLCIPLSQHHHHNARKGLDLIAARPATARGRSSIENTDPLKTLVPDDVQLRYATVEAIHD